ncbi:MAG: hypothetical protein ACI971_000966, partial [Colwellia sp.]
HYSLSLYALVAMINKHGSLIYLSYISKSLLA